MPELPEVETTRATLEPMLTGARIERAALGKPLRWPLGREVGELVGLRFGPARRRGKYLWLPLEGPAHNTSGLLVHLGMSGALTFHPASEPAPSPQLHEHFRVHTHQGVLRLVDPRRFGAVVWSPSLDAEPARSLLARLGKEPDDPGLTGAWFHTQLRRRRSPIKPVLLAGDIVVGAGNIYACEALFMARISPTAVAARLSAARAHRLLEAVQEVLARALRMGGTTLRDFKDAHGMGGQFQHQAAVYGREGQPCVCCGTAIERLVQAQRSTFFCPRCQAR